MILGIANFLWFGLSVVLAATTTITEDIHTSVLTYDSEVDIATGVIMAADNAVGSRTNVFKGLVTNNGEMYIGDSTNRNGGMTVRFQAGLINKGKITFNSLNETSAPSYYFYGYAFQNDGTIIMIGRGDTGGTTARVLPDKSFVAVNNGVLAWYQTTRNDGNGYNFGNEGLTVNNNGTVCLHQVGFYQWSKVIGTGCWSVGHNSVLYMYQPQKYYFSRGQLVYLETPYSYLLFNSQTHPNPITVDGFGNGNMIGFQSYPTYTYVGDTLTVKSGSNSYELIIGQGYNPDAFAIILRVAVANAYILPYALTYYGEPPVKSRPSECMKCPDKPWMAFA